MKIVNNLKCPRCEEDDLNHLILERSGARIFEVNEEDREGEIHCTTCHLNFIYHE